MLLSHPEVESQPASVDSFQCLEASVLVSMLPIRLNIDQVLYIVHTCSVKEGIIMTYLNFNRRYLPIVEPQLTHLYMITLFAFPLLETETNTSE